MLDLATFEAKIVQLCFDYLDCPVVIGRQGQPRPARPFASVDYVIAPQKIGHDDAYINALNEYEVQGTREVTLSVNYFGAEALEKMSELQMANEWPSVRDFLGEAITFVNASPVRDLSQIEGGIYRTRAQMDIVFRLKGLAVDPDVGYIEAVELNNEIDGSSTVVDSTP